MAREIRKRRVVVFYNRARARSHRVLADVLVDGGGQRRHRLHLADAERRAHLREASAEEGAVVGVIPPARVPLGASAPV